jgi:hypothetical protein
MVRVVGLGVVTGVLALLGAACGAQVQVGVAPVAVAGAPTCESVCPQMAACPGRGPTCPQTCTAARNLSAEARCEASLQGMLDCLQSQSANICAATHGACQQQTGLLGACVANYCTHPRIGADTAAWCLQAAAGF